jgi:septal ring-binding cell division protein DamX
MSKTLKISEETHFKLKVFCVKNKLKINKWIEKLILENINKYASKTNN